MRLQDTPSTSLLWRRPASGDDFRLAQVQVGEHDRQSGVVEVERRRSGLDTVLAREHAMTIVELEHECRRRCRPRVARRADEVSMQRPASPRRSSSWLGESRLGPHRVVTAEPLLLTPW